MVPSGINVPPGKFLENNKRTPWNKRTPLKIWQINNSTPWNKRTPWKTQK